jgi:hypothetical protein
MRRIRKPLTPFDETKASKLLEDLRAGRGFVEAMKRAGVTQRILYRWLSHSQRKGPESRIYKPFAKEFRKALADALGEAVSAGVTPHFSTK